MPDVHFNETLRVSPTSLKPDEHAPFTPHEKPLIPRMINIHSSLGKIGDKFGHQTLNSLEREQQQIKIWSQKELDRLANSSWADRISSSFGGVISSIMAAFTLYSGFSIFKAGEKLAGGTLISSAVFNLFQTALAHYGIRIEEILAEKNQALRDKLKMALPVISLIVNLTCSSLLGLGYIRIAANASLLEKFQALIQFLTTGGQLWVSFQNDKNSARKIEIEGETKFHENCVDLLTRLLEFTLEETRRMQSQVKQGVNGLIQAGTIAAHKV